ncbi:hypothetical protein MN116_004654, partial [Schistosoma mekongi]
IIYDSELGIPGEALIRRFAELHKKMEYYADFPIRNYSLSSPPKLKITIREFTFGLVCSLIKNDVHVIISLTTCTLAQLIEAQTIPYKIPHIAIPRPTCSKYVVESDTAKSTTTTIWIQPTPEQTGRAIYDMSELEHAPLSLLLMDKHNLEASSALELLIKSEMDDETFVPFISTQMFSITNQTNPMYPTSNTFNTIDVLLKRFQELKTNTLTFTLSHIYHIHVRPLEFDHLYKIYQDRYTMLNFYWILPTTLTIKPSELIRISTINQKEQVTTGFFRQFPILNEEDCLNLNISENMRLLISEIFQCNTNNITERELEAVYMILLSSQVTILMKAASLNFWDIPSIPNCDSPSFQPRPYGQLFNEIFISLAELPKWRNLLFYSLETNSDGQSKFILTGNFSENGNIKLTEYAQRVAKESLLSGLFPNTFRTFQNKTINVSTSFESPYIVSGEVTENNELLNAQGLVIDILDEFSRRLHFRYRLFLSPDRQYGAKLTNTTWSGMIGELLAGKTDIIAAPLTKNKERSEFVYFVGPFMEDTLGILLNIPKQNEELFQVFLPFRYDIWICLISSIFITAFFITIFSIISPFSGWNLALPGATSDEVSIYHSIWFTVGGMLMQGQELRAIANSARTVTLMYWLMILVIQATWQADLTAYLTKNIINMPFSSVEDLAYSDFSLAARKNSGTMKMLENVVDNKQFTTVYEKIKSNPISIYNLNDGVQYVRNNTRNVFLGDKIALLHMLPDNEETLTVVDDKNVVIPLSFAVRLNENYAPLMLNYMSILREKGVIDYLLEKWNVKKDKITSNAATFNLVTLHNVLGAFIVVAVFIVTSLIVLPIEILWHKHSIRKAELQSKSQQTHIGQDSLWRRFTNPSLKIPTPKLDLSRNPTLKQLKYAGHRRASAAFDATVIPHEHHTESTLQ